LGDGVKDTTILTSFEKYMSVRLDQVKERFALLPLRLQSSHEYKSVGGAGCCSETGKRNTNEDDEVLVDAYNGVGDQGFFGLYDGHGGRATVDFVVKALHLNTASLMSKLGPKTSFVDVWERAYIMTDAQLRRRNILRSGSTSVTCVVRTEGSKRVLYSANVGDSRAVLIRGRKAVRLTYDHKATCPTEAKRITDAGGFIGRGNRVNGVLAISRALGDHMLKENDVVSALPYCNTTTLNADDEYLLLACDGVWDVVTDQEAADFVLKKMKEFGCSGARRGKQCNDALTKVAKALAQEALVRRSLDNITTMVIRLN